MSKRIWMATAALLGAFLVVTLPHAKSPAEQSEKEASVYIGAVLSLTGSAAVWGQNAKMGIELALKEVNSKGVDGRKLRVLYEDSQSDPKTATSALLKLGHFD